MIPRVVDRLSKRVEQQIVWKSATQVKFIRPIASKDARGLVAAVYGQMTQDFQLLTPITVHSIIPELLAGVWCATRETLIAGAVPRLHKEVVAASVSQANQCSYCVDAHLLMLQGGDEQETARALAGMRFDKIEDRTLRELAAWVRRTRSAGEAAGRAPPFDQESAPEIIGTALAFHYTNRIVDVLLEKSPMELPWTLAWAKGALTKLAASTFAKRLIQVSARPGVSLRLLPDEPLPSDFAWAESNRFVAGAYARLAAVIDSIGQSFVPEPVRAVVTDRVARWNGEPMGLSRAWVEDEVSAIDESMKPAARLALVTALASFQIDSKMVEAFRARSPGDEALLATASWAAFTAARRVVAWINFH